ncbi:spermidine hydroxycinnamoyl transferase-like [Quillaja saponaria]|uniref:Spermidine hydroxycinnamoyl transferase-like n=1 Tax=Quillaja saponaria TaxID=32244 RepID=A0AAD7KQM4_QUISA|nr:spermidine hydroxycinnamoyl transferase-like [Quillaja saponaria]
MSSITSSCLITPSEPTPNGILRFSQMDLMVPLHHIPSFLYFYKPNHHNNITPSSYALIEKMKESLGRILVHYYPLAGRLRSIEGDQLVLECNAMGVEFLEAESNAKVSDYTEFAEPNKIFKDLATQFDYCSTPVEQWPLLLVKVTKFSCGGLCLCVAFSHIMVDGWALFPFIKSWAKLGRGEDLEEDEIPFHDRSIWKTLIPPFDHELNPQRCIDGQIADHSGFKAPPLLLGCSDSKEEQKKETTFEVLKITREQIEKLKEEANQKQTLPSAFDAFGRPYSRYEVVAAHMWRCACMARNGDKNQPTAIRIVADLRKRLKIDHLKCYFGNAVIPVLTPTCLYGDILSNPLSFSAQKIREATVMLTDEYLRSTLNHAENNMDAKKVHALSYESKNGYFYGNPNLSIGSLIGLPIYDGDFGWGKPAFMSLGTLGAHDGKSMIVPSPDGDGSFFVHLRLQTQHMETFKKFFYDHMD